MSKCVLACVKEGSKLRIKFHKFVNDEGTEYFNVYNNTFNCRFPKHLRTEGTYYEVGPDDITLSQNGSSVPFYTVKTTNIKIINSYDSSTTPASSVSPVKIFDLNECVICLSNPTKITFLQCGHKCVCIECYENNKKNFKNCSICRRIINKVIIDK